MESLFAILQSRELRLTNIRYMNDSKEISWLFELGRKVIWQERHATSRSGEEVKLCEMLLGHCDNLYLDETFFPNFYCACFSKNGDSLGQWRAYTNDGQGVAIGFNRNYLNSFAQSCVTRLEDVEYLDSSNLSDLKRQLHRAFSRLAESSTPLLDDQIAMIAREIHGPWDEKAPFCKNPAFKEEEEVRLVHMPNLKESRIGPIKFFCRTEMIVPYIALPLKPEADPISKIVFGPRNRLEHNTMAVSELVNSNGFRLGRTELVASLASYGEIRRVPLAPPVLSPNRQ
jgi:hypothetical protein